MNSESAQLPELAQSLAAEVVDIISTNPLPGDRTSSPKVEVLLRDDSIHFRLFVNGVFAGDSWQSLSHLAVSVSKAGSLRRLALRHAGNLSTEWDVRRHSGSPTEQD